MKIILAVDESSHSTWAADVLRTLPLTEPPHVHVLHVVDMEPLKRPFHTPEVRIQYKKIIEEETKKRLATGHKLVDAVADRLRERSKTIRRTVQQGHTAETIIAMAKKDNADLLVLGSHGRQRIEAFLMGSVSQKVSTYAPCSVLLVKQKKRTLKKILLSIDGSSYSEASERFLRTQLLPSGLNITVLHVWDHPVPMPNLFPALLEENKERTRLVHAGFKAHALMLQGHAAGTIVTTANDKHVDLVVLGSRGLSGPKQFFLGGVSQKVMKYADCAVLIVKKAVRGKQG